MARRLYKYGFLVDGKWTANMEAPCVLRGDEIDRWRRIYAEAHGLNPIKIQLLRVETADDYPAWQMMRSNEQKFYTNPKNRKAYA